MGELLLGSVLAKALTPIVTTMARKAFVQPVGAGLAPDPIRLDSRISFFGMKNSLDRADMKRLAAALDDRIEPVLEVEYRGLPDNEVNAAVIAVADTLEAYAPVVSDDVFDSNLDPDDLLRRIRARRPDLPRSRELTPQACDLYEWILRLCCRHIVEFTTTRPGFLQRAAVEQLHRTSNLERNVDLLVTSAGRSTEDQVPIFEQRYREKLLRRLDRLQLFGVTLTEESTYPLSTAYMSLRAESVKKEVTAAGVEALPVLTEEKKEPGTLSGDRVERMVSLGTRIVIRGGAGSGKTTLLQWLAVSCAKGELSDDLVGWSNLVPFFIPLRQFVQKGEFPSPEEFPTAGVGANLVAEMPKLWVHDQLRLGNGLVLVDGVDEVPESMRGKARRWLSDLVGDFPNSRYVVTSRPPAVSDDWLSSEQFVVMDLLAMSPNDVRMFIKHWHDAAREEAKSESSRLELVRYEQSLAEVVSSNRQISRLATNPLLCALLCALYRDRRMQLPRDRMELYTAALEMLLTRRDNEREIVSPAGVVLSATQSTRLLQKVAFWLISNGYSDAERDSVVARIAEIIQHMPRISDGAEAVYKHLLVRSGLLREPVDGRVDFVHRTFEEFLGAKEAVESENFGILVNNSHEDQWHGVFSMAVGHARPQEQQRLLLALIGRGDEERAPAIRAQT